jgi:hypothetical protein
MTTKTARSMSAIGSAVLLGSVALVAAPTPKTVLITEPNNPVEIAVHDASYSERSRYGTSRSPWTPSRRPLMAMRLTQAGTLLRMTAAVARVEEKFPKCFDASRNGHCVAVRVNGQQTVRLTKKTKKMLEPLGGLKSGGDVTHYEVPQPIRGELELRADWLPEAVAYFGAQPEVSVHVLPLDGQRLDTHAELSTAPSVKVGGSAVVTQADVVKGNRLPPGKYVLTVRVHGSKRNWDSQTLYVQVAE